MTERFKPSLAKLVRFIDGAGKVVKEDRLNRATRRRFGIGNKAAKRRF